MVTKKETMAIYKYVNRRGMAIITILANDIVESNKIKSSLLVDENEWILRRDSNVL
jgi:hypothetical protein